MGLGVDLGTPPGRGKVGRCEVGERCLRDHQVTLGVTDQVLHHALRFRVVALTEVGPEPVMGREPDIVGGRDHHVGDHPALQATHPVSQHHPRDPAQDLEALRQHRERRGRLLIGGEPDEPGPGPGQHGTEHVQPVLDTPVDQQVLTRRPHPRPATP